MLGYIFLRVLIAVVAFFVISIVVTLSIFMASIPEPEIVFIDISKLSPGEIEELLASGPSIVHHYPSYSEYYIRWVGGFFTGDWGESILGASH